MVTLRKRIAEALEREPLDLRDLSRMFHIREKEALEHLEHVVTSSLFRLVIDSSRCTECGFSFKKRTRLNTPGRCPLCKSESISPPRFQLLRTH
jgi:hypothetical protein